MADNKHTPLPTDARARKALPLVRGCLDYFPAALAAVSELSRVGNEQHNPGQPMHHARGKSTDHADCLLRHLMDRGTTDGDGIRHSAKVAWRALALLQEELEAEAGAPLARGARSPEMEIALADAQRHLRVAREASAAVGAAPTVEFKAQPTPGCNNCGAQDAAYTGFCAECAGCRVRAAADGCPDALAYDGRAD